MSSKKKEKQEVTNKTSTLNLAHIEKLSKDNKPTPNKKKVVEIQKKSVTLSIHYKNPKDRDTFESLALKLRIRSGLASLDSKKAVMLTLLYYLKDQLEKNNKFRDAPLWFIKFMQGQSGGKRKKNKTPIDPTSYEIPYSDKNLYYNITFSRLNPDVTEELPKKLSVNTYFPMIIEIFRTEFYEIVRFAKRRENQLVKKRKKQLNEIVRDIRKKKV